MGDKAFELGFINTGTEAVFVVASEDDNSTFGIVLIIEMATF